MQAKEVSVMTDKIIITCKERKKFFFFFFSMTGSQLNKTKIRIVFKSRKNGRELIDVLIYLLY